MNGIKKTPGVCGGEACIRDTRIMVWLLVRMRQLGMSDTEILQDYPTLRAEDLQNAWVYADANADEIEKCIQENETA